MSKRRPPPPANDDRGLVIMGNYFTTRLNDTRDAAILTLVTDGWDHWMSFDAKQLRALIENLQAREREMLIAAATRLT